MHGWTINWADVNWAAWAPVIVLVLAFIVFCIVDIVRHNVRYLPKWAWAIICCGTVPMGGIVYLIIGRDPAGNNPGDRA